jgi:hypothetical protein
MKKWVANPFLKQKIKAKIYKTFYLLPSEDDRLFIWN